MIILLKSAIFILIFKQIYFTTTLKSPNLRVYSFSLTKKNYYILKL